MTATRWGLGIVWSILLSGIVAAQTPLYRSKPLPPPPGEARQVVKPVSASEVLTGEAERPAMPAGPLPAGSIESPWCGGALAGDCNGPTGGNGPLTYEIMGYTGPSFPILGGTLNNRLVVGWMTGFDTRTLFFNQDQTAAWTLILGYSYTFNKGQDEQVNSIEVATPRQIQTGVDSNFNPIFTRNPIDGLSAQYIRALHRQTVNFGFGRDWWLNGPGALGSEPASNWRVGSEVGGRWGTGHVNFQTQFPSNQQATFFRRGGVHHGIYLGSHVQYERSFGSAVLYSGMRLQWGFNWMNYVPPTDGDLQDLNVHWTFGVRF
jgi:hypothetical protein